MPRCISNLVLPSWQTFIINPTQTFANNSDHFVGAFNFKQTFLNRLQSGFISQHNSSIFS